MKRIHFESKHFELFEVKKGVYVALVTSSGGGFANAGLIDLGDQIVIFDTFNTPQAAEDLRKAAQGVIGKPISYVVNSHWHGDHIRGNQVFHDCSILATKKTKELMDGMHPVRFQQQKDSIEDLRAHISQKELEMEKDQNPETKEKMRDYVLQLKEIEQTLPTLNYQSPTHTFESSYVIEGTEKSIELISLVGGHTACDIVLYIRQDKIIFTGDLLTVENHPFLRDGNPKNWVAILEKIQELDIELAIPGHGYVGSKQDINILHQYLLSLMKKHEVESNAIPDAYSNWKMPELYQSNLEFIKKNSFENSVRK
ncbi:MBL fold metallo-hydrolase [Peribacillus alkalitolerans]|uniref:MBL fold metallo-hydrolase n=1 Tax=Peribacillus alkalitolerans TaxID=1550385 RepID=UPI0013CFE008|nr:MBL fold metallo-hydrolase [Peribacillus alkalitolerans]